MSSPKWIPLAGRVVAGHRVASGQNGNPRFPGGTLRMQLPYFREAGLDLSPFFMGTINFDIAPNELSPQAAAFFFPQLKWHEDAPAEDFSFFDVRGTWRDASWSGYVYYPHPETKPEHFQKPTVIELLAPELEGLTYETPLTLEVRSDQVSLKPGPARS